MEVSIRNIWFYPQCLLIAGNGVFQLPQSRVYGAEDAMQYRFIWLPPGHGSGAGQCFRQPAGGIKSVELADLQPRQGLLFLIGLHVSKLMYKCWRRKKMSPIV